MWPLCAQQSITTATLSGRVEDTSGGGIPEATVQAVQLATNESRSVLTDRSGLFRFLALPPGNYELTVTRENFARARLTVTLRLGEALEVPLRLALARANQRLEITASAPVVEAARTQITDYVTPGEIAALPLNGRNYLDLALLVPGVSRTNTGAAQRFAETSAVPGTGISVASQRNLNNTFVIDGLSANDDAAALAGTFYSQEVIQEFQVVTSGGIAEFGRSSAGVVNIVTRGGTNQWHGRGYGFLRNQRLDARNPLAASKDPLTQTQVGGTAGGPLRKDRTFLFANFEQTRQNAAGFITIAPVNVSSVNQILARRTYPGLPVQTGEFTTRLDTTNFFTRFDHQLSTANRLTLRYNLYDVGSSNARTAGGLNAVSRGTSLGNRDHVIAGTLSTAISPATLTETRLQFVRSRLQAPPNDPAGPAVNISGIANFGTATSSPTGRDTDLIEANQSLWTLHGQHSLKAGVDMLLNRVNITFPGALQGVYTFSSLADFAAGRYINFQQAFGEARQFQSNPNLGAFVQEEWKPRGNLTVNAGLRYDVQWLSEPVHTRPLNVAPRLGIAYSPDRRKTVIRAGAGVYFDRVPLRALANALLRDGVRYRVAVVPFGAPAAPSFPAVLPAFPEGLRTAITRIDPQIRNNSSYQANVQVERELSPTTSVSAGYLYLRGLHVILSRNLNVPTLTADQAARLGDPNLGRPDARYGNISYYEGSGDSYYHGLTLALNRREGRWASFRLCYTLSKAIDNAGNFFFSSPQNNFNLRDDRGLSDNDQRHRVVASAVVSTPFRSAVVRDWQLSTIFSYTSALPFNILTGNDRNGDTNVNDRPIGVGRNTGRGFGAASVDFRLSRRFRMLPDRLNLEMMVESFNTLNRANWQLPNNVFGTGSAPRPDFGRPTAAGDPRQIQLGLRLDF